MQEYDEGLRNLERELRHEDPGEPSTALSNDASAA